MHLSLAHLKSPISCLLYKFVFKRYLDESTFTDEEVACILNEVTIAVRRYAKLGNVAGSRNSNHLEHRIYYDTIVDPLPTPLYRFLFNTYPHKNAVPAEDLQSIYAGLMEVAKRLDALREGRGCGYSTYSEHQSRPSSSMSDNVDAPSESGSEAEPDHAETLPSVKPNNSTQSRSNQREVSGMRIRRSDDEKLDEVVDKFSHISLDVKESANRHGPDDLHDLFDKKKLSHSGSGYVNHSVAEARPLRPVEVKEICTNASKTHPSNHNKVESSDCSTSGMEKQKQRDDVKVACVDDSRNVVSSARYPNEGRIRLTEYIRPYDGIRASLTGSPSKNCDGKRLNRPLGVTFDEALEQWIVADTDNDRVVLAPSGSVLTSTTMQAPCAVIVLEPGYSFVVLTKYDIRIMYHNKKEYDVVITHSGSARGLALTPRGNFLILEKIKGFWNICVYEGKPKAKLVNSAPYPNIENGLPSFLDVYRDLLIITDLGAQSIVRFSIEAKTEKLKFEERVFLGTGPKNRGHIEIKYISGVFIDDDENILVADAKGRSLQVFTSHGIFLHSIKVVSGGLPYISGIWVNRNGFIGACARAETNGGLYVYRIIVPPQTDYKIPSLRSKT
ncbi:hypothetical protein V3C99_008843 [Haemonchus contortus]